MNCRGPIDRDTVQIKNPHASGSHQHGDRKTTSEGERLVILHGDRKGPPGPTQPPSPLLYSVGAAKPVYSSGEGGAMGMGGPLRSPCWWLYLNSIGPCGCQAP